MQHILIIEDDPNIKMALEDDLRTEGFQVDGTRDGKQGLDKALQHSYDLIILDIMLPNMNGVEILKTLRSNNINTPVLILTAKKKETDKVVGLELGADDYITKPFSPRELIARVKAILRRSKGGAGTLSNYNFGNIFIDFKKYTAERNNQKIDLTVIEFEILRYLIQNNGNVVKRDDLLNEVWGKDVIVDSRTIDSHIAHLRKKIEDDYHQPKYLLTVRGVGYKFVE